FSITLHHEARQCHQPLSLRDGRRECEVAFPIELLDNDITIAEIADRLYFWQKRCVSAACAKFIQDCFVKCPGGAAGRKQHDCFCKCNLVVANFIQNASDEIRQEWTPRID
ncbi:MAG: hypothetical protein KDA46_14650, partial [Parvularculaceae bacterium]|nr:hypothetical protein [Parvularculaceae bacterium]